MTPRAFPTKIEALPHDKRTEVEEGICSCSSGAVSQVV